MSKSNLITNTASYKENEGYATENNEVLNNSDSAENKIVKQIKFTINNIGKAEELLSYKINDFDTDSSNNIDYMYDIVESLLSEENKVNGEYSISGTANEFHNFSVSILKIANDYATSLEFIEIGLKIHTSNTDLLADAIRYGYNCGRYEDCQNWYISLQSISKKIWTWRAFSFCIDFLIKQMGNLQTDEEVSKKAAEIIQLANEYQSFYPSDDSYYSESELYREINKQDEEINVLKKADENLNNCTSCWLRYADIMIDNGNYSEAEPIVKKLKRIPNSETSVNVSYVYYLDGLCKLYKMLEAEEFPEEEVYKTYKAFKKALKHSSLRQRTKSDILSNIEQLEDESEIKCPYDYKNFDSYTE